MSEESLGWIGPYHVERELGHGAMGTVYLARDPQLRRQLAIKVLAEGMEDEVDRARFEREVEALTKLGTHPGIVGLASAGTLPDGRPYLAMDYVEGQDLEQLLKLGLSKERIVDYTLQVASALGFAHELGVVHRDVKPGNVLIEASGERAFLADFGLVRFSGSKDQNLTMTGEIVGTPAYMAPEQLHPEGYGEVGPWTDVYALGAMIYFALTGRSANGEGGAIALMANLASGERPAPLSILLEDDFGRRVAPVVDIALNLRPSERYPSASVMAEALSKALEGESPAPPISRSSLMVLGGALIAIAIAAVGAGVVLSRPGASPTPTLSPGGQAGLDPVLAAFSAGETGRARRLLGEGPFESSAAPVLIASGEAKAALKAVGPRGVGLDPFDWARAAAEAQDTEAHSAALRSLGPGPAMFLAVEAGQEVEDNPLASAEWRQLTRAVRGWVQGDVIFARLEVAELLEKSDLEVQIRWEAVSLSIRLELALGDLRSAVRAWEGWAPTQPLGEARRVAWASLLAACAAQENLQIESTLLATAAARAPSSAPGLAATRAADAINSGDKLSPGAPQHALELCLRRGQRWLALAEAGLDPRGAERALRLLDLGRGASSSSTVSRARALRLSNRLTTAREVLDDAPSSPEKALLVAQLSAQALDEAGLGLDLARLDDSTPDRESLRQGWAGVAEALGDPTQPRLRLALGAALAEQGEAEEGEPAEAVRERARRILRRIAGDPSEVVAARVALAEASLTLGGSRQDVRSASLELAARGEEFLAGDVPPLVRLEALRVLGCLGETEAAQAYLGLCADLPARAWLSLGAADVADSRSERRSWVSHVERLSRGRLGLVQLGQGAPSDFARALLAISDPEVRFGSTRSSLERLGRTVIDHPDATSPVLQLLAWDPDRSSQAAGALREDWSPKTPAEWLARALSCLVGEEYSPAELREAIRCCGVSIRTSERPLPGAHLIRGLCLKLSGPKAGDLSQQDLEAARAGIPWSQGPWRAELTRDPDSEWVLDELTSRGGIRLQKSVTLDTGGLFRLKKKVRAKLKERAKQAKGGKWGKRSLAVILLRHADKPPEGEQRPSLERLEEKLRVGISDKRVRKGALARGLRELAKDTRRVDRRQAARAAWEAIWARPLGGAACGQALTLELRDRVPFSRAPLFGELVTKLGEPKLKDIRGGTYERRFWMECDLLGRQGLMEMVASEGKQPLLSREDLLRPGSLSRALLEVPWDRDINQDALDQSLPGEDWRESALALRRAAAYAVLERAGSALIYETGRRVLKRVFYAKEAAAPRAWGLLAAAVRDAVELSDSESESKSEREATRKRKNLTRLRGLEADVLIYRASRVEGEDREAFLDQTAELLEGASAEDVSEGRRFFAHWRVARLALLRGEDPEDALKDALRRFGKQWESDRKGYLRAVKKAPFQGVLEANEAYAEWLEDLERKDRKRKRESKRSRRHGR
ncbi:MAG: serine/threonine protein kinase [Planctomycetes bacterium]|nr:serine/threonine protein kinase [Planctomycetota bacterium]